MEKTAKNRGGGGGKLNRSETVTIRLDPKLRYLTELAARKHRRTVSSFIEWAIERTLDEIVLGERYDEEAGVYEVNLGNQSELLWDTDEADRLAKLGLHYPELLTHDEQVLWKLIRENGYLWKGKYDESGKWQWKLGIRSLIFQRLREHWDEFKQVASGDADKSILPTWIERESTPAPSKKDIEEMDFTPPLEDEDIPL